MKSETTADFEAVLALAFMGNIATGQPIDYLSRAARIARCIADALQLDVKQSQDVAYIALLR